MKKSIVYIIPELHWGGAQSVLLHLCIFFSQKGYSNRIIYFHKDDCINPLFNSYCDALIHCSQEHAFRDVIKTINEIKPDIINTHLPIGKYRLFFELWKTKIPVIATLHSHSNLANPSIKERFKIWLLQHFINKMVFVAEYSYDYFVKELFKSSRKCITIHNGVSIPEEIQECAYPFEKQYTHIISVANYRYLKGYQYAIPAIKELVKEFPNIRYHILGTTLQSNPSEDSGPWIKQYIQDNNLQETVLLHGSQDDVFQYLIKADIFLTASERELLPMSILEAMNCGLPIVSTDVGGIKEIIGSDNEFGILVPPKSIDSIQLALKELLQNTQKQKELQQKSKARALDFSVNTMGMRYLELFEKEM